MRITYLLLILLVLLLGRCDNPMINLNGYYTTSGDIIGKSYHTLDINDSLVIVNKSSVCFNEIDTIFIDPKNNSFISGTRVYFPFVDLKAYNDSVVITFMHDAGNDDIVFYKREYSKSIDDVFSISKLEIKPEKYNSDSMISIDYKRVVNFMIGPLKDGYELTSVDRDSILIELYGFLFFDKSDYRDYVNGLEKKSVVCLNFDRRISEKHKKEIMNELKIYSGAVQIVESRIKEDKLVYIK